MFDWLFWLIIGGVAGGIASLIVPGRTPGGMIGAIIILFVLRAMSGRGATA